MYIHHARLNSEDTIIINKFVLHANLYAKNKIEVLGENLKAYTSAVIASTLSSDSIIKIQSVGTELSGRTHLKICDLSEKLADIDLITKDMIPPVTITFFDKKLKIDSKKSSVKFIFDQNMKNIVVKEEIL